MIRFARRSRAELVLAAVFVVVLIGIIDRWIASSSIMLRDYRAANYAKQSPSKLDPNRFKNAEYVGIDSHESDLAGNKANSTATAPRARPTHIRKISMSQMGAVRDRATKSLIRGTQIPKKIWQKWKNRIDTRNIWMQDDYIREGWFAWRAFNPSFDHTVLSDADAELFVRSEYAHRPDIVKVFVELQQRIISFDLLRYLVIYRHGGVYNDMDTNCRVPIDDWFRRFSNYGIVAGIEASLDTNDDLGLQIEAFQLTARIQFVQWTVMARPGHPMINRTIEALVSRIYQDTEENGVKRWEIGDLFYEAGNILNVSGPGLYTREVRKYLNQVENRIIDDDEIANLTSITQFGDMLILPVNKWAPEQPHSNSGSEVTAFLRHSFKGTWR
ncbi:hypothetical protein DRE_03882 [Drechslerella stenobrocha 248]|uniref:Initiation-specific alpha-1,6-mannosyltransferase n=1 Tax=Drechslerella stenobrocha 248 TaxID=1043628 RepID=W7ICL8_9PEZI|nr:hypothetical protein DRE_03882 [Drechslerella stenobrocha 248]